jgi:hypothetical protein
MLDFLIGLGAVAAIVAVLPPLGIDIRIFGREKSMSTSVGVTIPKWRWWLIMAIACTSLFGTGYNYYRSSSGSLEIESSKSTGGAILGYGLYPNLGPGYEFILADCDALAKYRERYKIVGVAFHYAGTTDRLDTPLESKSEPYEIETGTKNIVIKNSVEFEQEMSKGYRGTTYALLLVPKGVTTSQFTTLRQAYGFNVLSVGGASGPP